VKTSVTLLGLAALVTTTLNANAQDCNTFLTDIEAFVHPPQASHQVSMNMMTLASNAGEATYSAGAGWPSAVMTYVPAYQVGARLFPATLRGTFTTFYNDRLDAAGNPFSPLAKGQRTVWIFLGDYPYPPIRYSRGDVVVTDPNNSNGQPPTFKASCESGLMFGFVRQNQIIALSLTKDDLILQK
jgi:hypothetical protein